MVNPKLEATFYADFITSTSAGAATDADSTPTCEIFEDDTDVAILSPTVVKRTSKTGNYRIPVACTAANGFEAGKSYNVIASATIGGVAAKAKVATFQVRARSIDDASTYAGGDTSGTTTLLSRLTSTRAGYLDNLANTPPTAAEIKTALEASGSSLDTLLSRLTSTRAGYLDKLNITGNVAAQGDVLNVGNNTRVRATIPQVLERPDSGSESVPLTIELYDGEGNMEAPDSTPTVTLAAQDGTDLSARVGSLSSPSTGRYTFNYTNAAAHSIEVLRWTVTVVEGGATRTYSYLTQLVDTSAVDFTSSDRSTIASILGYVDDLEGRLSSVRAALLDNLQYLTSAPLTASGTRSALGMSSANMDTQLATIDNNLDSVKAKTDQMVFTTANKVDATASVTLSAEDIAEIADGVVDGLAGVDVTIQSPVSTDGGTITAKQGDAWSISLTGLGNLGANEIAFAVKSNSGDDDDDSILLIRSDTGLQRLNGATTTTSNGAATITNPTTGAVTITVKTAATLVVPKGRAVWAVKKLGGVSGASTITEGDFVVNSQLIEAVS